MKFNHKLHFFVFTHIPKCGGTSLHDCLKAMLKDKYVVKTPKIELDSLDNQLWGMGGHRFFGHIPPRILDGRRPIYMTILRHPWSRFVSFFNHVAVRPEHHAHKCVPNFNELKPIEVIHKWKALGSRNINNLQTQMICNKNPETATATEAIENIKKHYRFVSTVDHIDEVLDEVSDFFNVDRQPLKKLNVTNQQNKVKIDDAELFDEVMKLNQKDLLLYRYVASRITDTGTSITE